MSEQTLLYTQPTIETFKEAREASIRAKALELAVRLAASGQVSFYVDSPSYGTVKVARIFEEYLKGEAK